MEFWVVATYSNKMSLLLAVIVVVVVVVVLLLVLAVILIGFVAFFVIVHVPAKVLLYFGGVLCL